MSVVFVNVAESGYQFVRVWTRVRDIAGGIASAVETSLNTTTHKVFSQSVYNY